MFNDFMKNKNGIPSPEKIYLITSLTVSAAALSTTCLLEHISKQAYQKGKNQTTKQEEISIEQENTMTLSTEDEEVLNLMPYFKEEANALYKEHAEVVYHDKLYHSRTAGGGIRSQYHNSHYRILPEEKFGGGTFFPLHKDKAPREVPHRLLRHRGSAADIRTGHGRR